MKAHLRPRNVTGRRRNIAAVLAATVILGGAGAATAVAYAGDGGSDDSRASATDARGAHHDRDHDGHEREDRDRGDDEGDGAALLKGAKVDLKQAVAEAMKSVRGTATAVDLERGQDKPVWEVEITDAHGTEHEVTVNALDGRIVATTVDEDDDSGDREGDARLARSAKTDLATAVDAALARVQGTATSAELEGDHGGTVVWQVEIADAKGGHHEVAVDARTGAVQAAEADVERGGHSGSGDHEED
ncbi:PepSY domain-containing protein [Streptomyces palmae]|uniref:PepSY domain-containing protein n=1 Tax=Streptomyces palmae TaxID=1701085 RepID=A0A4Z0HG65_9ACTN|nr:PepSY domain-containing protein [Streptomyces palmae]TGB14982.1 hypothetical protein E4099_07465 [Streptomyces palmae]